MEGTLQIMLLDDEPIVGKRLKPALAKYGFDVEVFEDATLALMDIDGRENGGCGRNPGAGARARQFAGHEGHHHHRIRDRGGRP